MDGSQGRMELSGVDVDTLSWEPVDFVGETGRRCILRTGTTFRYTRRRPVMIVSVVPPSDDWSHTVTPLITVYNE